MRHLNRVPTRLLQRIEVRKRLLYNDARFGAVEKDRLLGILMLEGERVQGFGLRMRVEGCCGGQVQIQSEGIHRRI